jgi:predicted Zn-dependent protease
MKKVSLSLSLIAVLSVVLVLAACESMGQVAQAVSTGAQIVSAGTQVAAAAGLVDDSTAAQVSATTDSITASSDAIAQAAEEITPEQEYYIGRAVGATIFNSYKVYTANPGLTTYLNKIANTIVINSEQPELYNGCHVAILDSDEINAFATSSGLILITRGLIACATTEDALAAALAHEIAHMQLQHSIKSIKTARFTNAILVTGTSVAEAAGAGQTLDDLTQTFGMSVQEIVSTMVNSGYSQQQEFDADATALKLLASAGYEPSSLLDMLRSLETNQPRHSGGFNKTHPSPALRLANAATLVGNYRVQDTRAFRTERFRVEMQ